MGLLDILDMNVAPLGRVPLNKGYWREWFTARETRGKVLSYLPLRQAAQHRKVCTTRYYTRAVKISGSPVPRCGYTGRGQRQQRLYEFDLQFDW